MSSMREDLEVSMRFVTDPGGEKSVRALAGALGDAAEAESDLKRATEQRQSAYRSPAAPNPPPAGRVGQAERADEQIRRILQDPGIRRQGFTADTLRLLPRAVLDDMGRAVGVGQTPGGKARPSEAERAAAVPSRAADRPRVESFEDKVRRQIAREDERAAVAAAVKAHRAAAEPDAAGRKPAPEFVDPRTGRTTGEDMAARRSQADADAKAAAGKDRAGRAAAAKAERDRRTAERRRQESAAVDEGVAATDRAERIAGTRRQNTAGRKADAREYRRNKEAGAFDFDPAVIDEVNGSLKELAQGLKDAAKAEKDAESQRKRLHDASPQGRADALEKRQQERKEYDALALSRGLREKRRDEMTVDEIVAKERAAADRKKVLDNARIEAGLKEPPKWSPADKPGYMHALSTIGSTPGLGALARFGGAANPAAGAAAVALMAAQEYGRSETERGRVDESAFLSERARAQGHRQALPVVGGLIAWAQAADRRTMGLSDQARQVTETDFVKRREMPNRLEALRAGMDRHLDVFAPDRRFLELGSASLGLERPKGFDRGSVLGAKLYREEERTLPHTQAIQVAKAEQAAAAQKAAEMERQAADLLEKENRLTDLFDRSEEVREHWSKARTFGGDFRHSEDERDAALRSDRLAKERVEVSRMRADALKSAREARDEATGLGAEAAGHAAERRRAELGNLRDREVTATDQAHAAVFAGVDGRARAAATFDLIKQIGIENAPGALIGQAQGLFGEELGKMAERAAPSVIQPLRDRSPGAYRDDPADLRRQMEVLRQQSAKDVADIKAATAQELANNAREYHRLNQQNMQAYHKHLMDEAKADARAQAVGQKGR